MKLRAPRLDATDLAALRRATFTAVVVAIVETPLAMALGAFLGYAVGPKQPCRVTIDTTDLPVGTVIRVDRDRLIVLPKTGKMAVWEATGEHRLRWDGWRWAAEP